MQFWCSILMLSWLYAPILAAETQVYKTTSENGTTSFSDIRSATNPTDAITIPKTNQMQIVTPSTLNQYKRKSSTDPKQKKQGPKNYVISIHSPQPEEMFRNENANAVSVTTSTKPSLFPGHKLRVFHNGQLVDGTQLSNLHRGAHKVKVEIIGHQDQVISSSDTITFYVQRPTAK